MNSSRFYFTCVTFLSIGAGLLAQNPSADGSRANLKTISGAVKAYSVLNKKAPANLAALLEDGLVAGTNAFVIPGGGHAAPARGDVDAKGDYTLESLAGAPDLVVREKQPTHTPGQVLAIFKDGSIKPVAMGGAGGEQGAPTTPAVTNALPASDPMRAQPRSPSQPAVNPPRNDDPPRVSTPVSRAATTQGPGGSTTGSSTGSRTSDRLPPSGDFEMAGPARDGVALSQPGFTRSAPPAPPLGPRTGSGRDPSATTLPSAGLDAGTVRSLPPGVQPGLSVPDNASPNPRRSGGATTITFPPGTAIRGSGPGGQPTEDEAAAIAQAMQIFRQRAEAESARDGNATNDDSRQVFTNVREGGTVRFDDLPPAGLTTMAGSQISTAGPDRTARRSTATDSEVAVWLKAGRTAEAQGDIAEARDHYEMVLAARPNSIDALFNLGNLHNQEGELKEGISRYQAAQLQMPESAVIALKLAELYVGVEDLERARREAERALAADTKSALAMSWLASVEMLEGDRGSSAARFQKAMQTDPRVVEQRYRNIEWMLGSGQARRATIEAVSVLSMQPNHRGAIFAAGEAYAELQNRDRAAAYFRRYLELDSTSEQATEARQRLRELGTGTRAIP